MADAKQPVIFLVRARKKRLLLRLQFRKTSRNSMNQNRMESDIFTNIK